MYHTLLYPSDSDHTITSQAPRHVLERGIVVETGNYCEAADPTKPVYLLAPSRGAVNGFGNPHWGSATAEYVRPPLEGLTRC